MFFICNGIDFLTLLRHIRQAEKFTPGILSQLPSIQRVSPAIPGRSLVGPDRGGNLSLPSVSITVYFASNPFLYPTRLPTIQHIPNASVVYRYSQGICKVSSRPLLISDFLVIISDLSAAYLQFDSSNISSARDQGGDRVCFSLKLF